MPWMVGLMPLYAFPIVLLLMLLSMDRLQWKSGLRTSPERQGRRLLCRARLLHTTDDEQESSLAT